MAERIGAGERNGRKTWVYDNGMQKYQDTGHIAAPPPNTLITVENTTAMHRARQEQKRAAVIAAANAAVERDDYRKQFGDMAFVAAVTEAQYVKATTPDDSKSTDAARFLLHESGLSESLRTPNAGAVVGGAMSDMIGLVRELLQLAERVSAERADVVDGTISSQIHETNDGGNEG